MILIDTSVWVDHLRSADARLVALLERGAVLMHPWVTGELACGNLRNRKALLDLWRHLPALAPVADHEALFFLENHRLMGRGVGFIDIHLLAAVALAGGGARLWTRDKRLQVLAKELGLGFTDD